MEYFNLYIAVPCFLSALLLLKPLISYIWHPKLLLKHPNQLHFCALLFWDISLWLTAALPLIVLLIYTYTLEVNYEYLYYFYYCYFYLQIFVSFLFLHYFLALNIEIIIKLFRSSSEGYKIRVLIHHLVSITCSVVILIVILLLMLNDNSNYITCVVISFCYSGFLTFGVWVCAAIYFKRMITSKSSSLLNLFLFTIATTLILMARSLLLSIFIYFKTEDVGSLITIPIFLMILSILSTGLTLS